jgi:tetratricopeptide (TPR) repeat protein
MTSTVHCGITFRIAIPLLTAATLAGCAAASSSPRGMPALDVPTLEARVAADSGDAQAAVMLGAAYREAGRLDDARGVLERVRRRAPQNEDAVLFLGLVYEEQNELDRARELYQRYIAQGVSRRMRDELRGRLALLEQRVREAEVQAAVAQEARLATTAPEPNTVAVFPFLFGGGDESLRPLERALAEFMVTDLSQTGRLRVLERVRVQQMLDEVALSESGRVDSATAVRGGRLLRAASVVQGRFAGTEQALNLEARVARVTASGSRASGQAVERRGDMDALFQMQKALAVGVYQRLGVQLSPTERERVMRIPTTNLHAVLAFGRGLQAADAGQWAQAAEHFLEAARLDPGFSPAASRAGEAVQAARALAVTTADLATMARIKLEHGAEVLDAVDALLPGAQVGSAVAQVLGISGLRERAARVERLFGRP